jgi:tripartite-type tricarboxylate transporter receptor subunit TctC
VGLPMIRAGKLRALAVFTARRISFAPDIPTMAEAGLPGFELNSWHAVFMPAGTPREIVQRMAELTNAVFATDKGREFLLRGSMEAYPGSPDSLGRLVESEMQKWGQIIRSAGIEPE